MHGATRSDSVKVYFELNKAAYLQNLNNNDSVSMSKFIDAVAASAKAGTLRGVEVRGYTSPEGAYLHNEELARRRCNVIADYISRNAGISMSRIKSVPGGVAWNNLRQMISDDRNFPSRDSLLIVLDKYLPGANTNATLSERCLKSLMAVDNGKAYHSLSEYIFPKLRIAEAACFYDAPDAPACGSDDHNNTLGIESQPAADYPQPADTADTDTTAAKHIPLHRLALKTNLLYDAALLPNLELEYLINRNWSVALEGDIAWWGKYSRNRSYRLVVISPEVKYWIKPRAAWHGFYVGLFAGGGYYDFLKGKHGYYGDGGMAGVSAGFMWPVTRSLSLEAGLGAGYLYSKCR
ncbi:MAG: DUF3575 domain-containing protein [Muribaculaceae bacterium]|nr:DUF3575 domain-containing protein [Muribaculaceae bacterium]